jgi:hypothetical protein
MSDLEQRLRDAVVRRSWGFEPAPDLPDRIVSRVGHRARVRRLAATTAAAAAAAVVVIVSLVATRGHDEGSMWATTPGEEAPAPTGRDRETATSTSSTTSVTDVPGTRLPADPVSPVPGLDILTGLSRQGLGPITAGMTLRSAQEVAGVAITPEPGGTARGCAEARIEGFEGIVLVVEPPGAEADAMDGVVRAVSGSVLPTAEGAQVGQYRNELLAALGPPTRTEDSSVFGGGAQFLVFESGGFAYGALVVNDMVLGLQSGDPAWVSDGDGCPA